MIALRSLLIGAGLSCALACSPSSGPNSAGGSEDVAVATASQASAPPGWIEETILAAATPAGQPPLAGTVVPVPLALDREGTRLLVGGTDPLVFVRTGQAWHIEGPPLPKATPDDVADLVAISGELALIGGRSLDLLVFGLDASNTARSWTLRGRIEDPCSGSPARALSLSSHTAVVGCGSRVRVYERKNTALAWKQDLAPQPDDDARYFGWSFALDGSTLVLGSPRPDFGPDPQNLPGRVHVYLRWGTQWYRQTTLVGSNGWFGGRVQLFGDTLAVMAAMDPLRSVSASLYVRTGSTWTFEREIAASPGETSSFSFATDTVFFAKPASVEASVRQGSTWLEPQTVTLPVPWTPNVVASAQHAAVSHGDSITILERSGAGWRAAQSLGVRVAQPGRNSMAPGNFAISGTRAALIRDDTGLAHVFSQGSSWAPVATHDLATTPAQDLSIAVSGDDLLVVPGFFPGVSSASPPRLLTGISSGAARAQELVANDRATLNGGFALRGDVAVIGAPGQDTAYVFRRTGAEWRQEGKLSLPENGDGFEFGRAVDVRGEVAVVGAPRNHLNELFPDPTFSDEAGEAHVFVRSTSGWRHQQKLSPIEGKNPSFGMAVRVFDTAVAVGAHFYAQLDNALQHAPGVHTYALENGAWRPDALLAGVAHGGDAKEAFGFSLGATTDALVVGALGLTVPSAAYVFRRAAGAWVFEQRFDDPLDRSFGAYVAAGDDRLLIGALHAYPRVFRRARTKAGGAPCSSSNECVSNTCLDGVCCAGPCVEACRSCAGALTGTSDGTCAPVAAGTRCGPDPLDCKTATRYRRAKRCTAQGTCTEPAGDVCQNSLACLSAGYCAWDCAASGEPTDELCAPDAWCKAPTVAGQRGTCTADFMPGAECEKPAQCLTGLCEWLDIPGCAPRGSDDCRKRRCVGKLGDPCTVHEDCSPGDNLHCSPEGVCCNMACTGKCESCNQDGVDDENVPKRGQCLPHTGDPAPGHEACEGTGICKGTCSGQDREQCHFERKQCAPARCNEPSFDSVTPAAYCDDKGRCDVKESTSCQNYKCDASGPTPQCKLSCTSDNDCADGKCVDNRCRVAGPTCEGSYTARNAAGREERCNGFCESGACTKKCLADTDCLQGNRCGADKLCTDTPDAGVGPTRSDEDAGSCACRAAGASVGGASRAGGLVSLALLFALGARRRARSLFRRRVAAPTPSPGPVTLLASLGAVSGCAIVGGYEDFSLRAEGGAGGGASCADAGRPLTDHFMTSLDYGSGCFWMDSTEVSIGQYARFLGDSRALAAPPPPGCEDNVIEAAPPQGSDAASCRNADRVSIDAQDGRRPVVCVDWCDAATYCTWAGLTLCRDAISAPSAVQSSDWFAACSNGGTTRYPVRADETNRTCNWAANPASGCDVGACIAEPVFSLDRCRNDAGVLHLSGNVSEWTSACRDGDCATRGGAINTQAADAPCASYRLERRDVRDATIGFRCCSRP